MKLNGLLILKTKLTKLKLKNQNKVSFLFANTYIDKAIKIEEMIENNKLM